MKIVLIIVTLLCGLPRLTEAEPVIVVDAGHGGSGRELDHSSPNNASFVSKKLGRTIMEKELTLEIATEIARVINASGRAKALLTRTKDENVGMNTRAAIATGTSASTFVSIHLNSTPSATGPVGVVQGTVYQGNPANTPEQMSRDQAFAHKLAQAVATVSAKYLPGTKARPSEIYRSKPEGSHLFRYLREDAVGKTMDGCFLEIDFMDNPKVAAWLIEGEHAVEARKEIAAAVASALIDHAEHRR